MVASSALSESPSPSSTWPPQWRPVATEPYTRATLTPPVRLFWWRKGLSFSTNTNYLKVPVGVGVSLLVCAFLSMSCALVFCSARYVCNRCGGLTGLAVVALFAVGSALVANALLDHELHIGFGLLHSSEDNALRAADRITHSFNSLASLNTSSSSFKPLNMTKIAASTSYFTSRAALDRPAARTRDFNVVRSLAMFAAFAFAMSAAASALSAAFLRKRLLAVIAGVLFTCSSASMFTVAALHVPVSIVVEDMCELGYGYLSANANPTGSPFLDKIYACSHQNETRAFLSAVYSPLRVAISHLNASLPASFPDNETLYSSYLTAAKVASNSVSNKSLEMEWKVTVALMSIFREAQAIGRCDAINAIVSNFYKGGCEHISFALYTLIVGVAAFVSGCVGVAGGYVGFTASKRFARSVYKDLEDFDDYADDMGLLGSGNDGLNDDSDEDVLASPINTYSTESPQSPPSPLATTAAATKAATHSAERLYAVYARMQRWRRMVITFCLMQTLLAVTHIATLPWRDDDRDVNLAFGVILSAYVVLPLVGMYAVWRERRRMTLVYAGLHAVLAFGLVFLIVTEALGVAQCAEPEKEIPDVVNPCSSLFAQSDGIVALVLFSFDLLQLALSFALVLRYFFALRDRRPVTYSDKSTSRERGGLLDTDDNGDLRM